jgi:hypothetical protein
MLAASGVMELDPWKLINCPKHEVRCFQANPKLYISFFQFVMLVGKLTRRQAATCKEVSCEDMMGMADEYWANGQVHCWSIYRYSY